MKVFCFRVSIILKIITTLSRLPLREQPSGQGRMKITVRFVLRLDNVQIPAGTRIPSLFYGREPSGNFGIIIKFKIYFSLSPQLFVIYSRFPYIGYVTNFDQS